MPCSFSSSALGVWIIGVEKFMTFLQRLTITCLFLISSKFSTAAYASQTFEPQNQVDSSPAAQNVILGQNKCDLVQQKYNHYAYQEAGRDILVSIGNGQFLHQDAARAFTAMQQAAKKDGIILTPISGFRSISQQDYLFYGVAKRRRQSLEERAKVSAPPGHSQHHTGFAIDINSLNPAFGNTKAFAWLQHHAQTYGFELSFPHENTQGISFEPWHWAWHGNEEAKQALHDECV